MIKKTSRVGARHEAEKLKGKEEGKPVEDLQIDIEESEEIKEIRC